MPSLYDAEIKSMSPSWSMSAVFNDSILVPIPATWDVVVARPVAVFKRMYTAAAPNVTVTLLYPPTESSAALSAVVFYRANGTVSSIGRVDAEGKVRGFVTPDGAITMIKHVPGMGANAPAQSEIRTVVAVQPGDDIRIGYRFNHQPFSPVTVNGPTCPGAASYTVTSYCNRGTSGSPVSTVPTGIVTQVAGCSNADFLLNARNAAGERIATLFQGGVAVCI